jgi:hypothetical protein
MVAQLNTDAVLKKKSVDELRGRRRLADHLRSRRGLQGRRDPEEARDHEPDPGRRDAPARLSPAKPCRRITFSGYDGQGNGFHRRWDQANRPNSPMQSNRTVLGSGIGVETSVITSWAGLKL